MKIWTVSNLEKRHHQRITVSSTSFYINAMSRKSLWAFFQLNVIIPVCKSYLFFYIDDYESFSLRGYQFTNLTLTKIFYGTQRANNTPERYEYPN